MVLIRIPPLTQLEQSGENCFRRRVNSSWGPLSLSAIGHNRSTTATPFSMGEHIERQKIERRRIARNRPTKQSAVTMGRRLLDIVVYDKGCRIGEKLTLDDLAETSEVGDWKMADFRSACSYAASQGWLSSRTICSR